MLRKKKIKSMEYDIPEPIAPLRHAHSFLTETDFLPTLEPNQPNYNLDPLEIDQIVEDIQDENTDLYSVYSVESEGATLSVTDYGTVQTWNPIEQWDPELAYKLHTRPFPLQDSIQSFEPRLHKVPNFETRITSNLRADITESIADTDYSYEVPDDQSFDNDSTLTEIEIPDPMQVKEPLPTEHICRYCLGISSTPCILPPRPPKSPKRHSHTV